MSELDEDPIIGRYFDTAEKKAKWLVRIKFLYIFWIVFVIVGIMFLLFFYLLK